MELYLLRHGKSVTPGTYIGATDSELSETGYQEIRALNPLLSGLQLDHCYCSPMRRCRESADLLDLQCDCSYDDNLREIDFGVWEGLSFAEISVADGPRLQQWLELKDTFVFPEGDSITEFNNRIGAWFGTLLEQQIYERVLIVTHAGVIRTGLCRMLNLDYQNAFSFAVEEAALSLVVHEAGHARLVYLNRRSP
jgi:broad specificity phosphatase PhoE